VFLASTKKKIQLTFEDVLIKTIPQQRKCCNKNAEPQKPKIILENVSGTIQPGQFLAIIGASGKYNKSCLQLEWTLAGRMGSMRVKEGDPKSCCRVYSILSDQNELTLQLIMRTCVV
jgi:ABC-type transport system involved in cytochrome bd biosynthesis fused ATPase/permease subunit